MKQYLNLQLPVTGYVLRITGPRGQHVGYYPLTSPVPTVFPTRAEAERIKLWHQRIQRVRISAF